MKINQFWTQNGRCGWEEREMTKEEEESWKALQEEQKEGRRLHQEHLMSLTGAPKRHLSCATEISGEWGKKLSYLKSKLNTGFLIALVGIRGNGKTQLSVCLMRAVGGAARYVTSTSFFTEIKSTFQADARKTQESILRSYSEAPLLVIDEIGKRSDSDWENNLLFELLNTRYNDMKDTLLVDNRTKAEFIASIGPSIASRMSETGGIIECEWESFR